jgi:hypothetical protein
VNAVRIKLIVGAVLILIGVGFALLSKEWIEETLGFEPDGGNGVLELAFVIVPIGIGVALVVTALSALRQQRAARLPEG